MILELMLAMIFEIKLGAKFGRKVEMEFKLKMGLASRERLGSEVLQREVILA